MKKLDLERLRAEAAAELQASRDAERTYAIWPCGIYIMRAEKIGIAQGDKGTFGTVRASFIDLDTGTELPEALYAIPTRAVKALSEPGEYFYENRGEVTTKNGHAMFDIAITPRR